MSQAAIELRGLTKQYGSHRAVNELDLRVDEGSIYGLLRPDGAGKSTTIRMVLSLIRPTAGSSSVLGRSYPAQRNLTMRDVGCIIEKPDFYIYLSARRNLELFAPMSLGRLDSLRIREMFDIG
jgi:ABC-type multidrug transport system ATPase subunit